jgi:hypothetical protein
LFILADTINDRNDKIVELEKKVRQSDWKRHDADNEYLKKFNKLTGTV